MPTIDVQPRYIAAPWELEKCEAHRIVGLEDYLEPEPGVLAEYRSVFPDRYVEWDRHFQLWSIYQRNPLEGGPPTLIERLFFWDSAPDPITGRELTDEQIASMAGKDPAVVRRFMPFDHPFVRRRIQDAEITRNRGISALVRRIDDRNAALARSKRRDMARNLAASQAEQARWNPVLEEYQRTGRWHPGARTAMVRGGFTLHSSR